MTSGQEEFSKEAWIFSLSWLAPWPGSQLSFAVGLLKLDLQFFESGLVSVEDFGELRRVERCQPIYPPQIGAS